MSEAMRKKIQYLNFIMTCFMVFYHVPMMRTLPAKGRVDALVNPILDNGFKTMGVLVMCYFFTVTGFLLFRNLSMKTYPQKIKRRCFSLLIPYLLWQIVFGIVFAVRGDIASFSAFLTKTFTLGQFPPDAALWYMYVVFGMALLSPILLVLFRKKNLGWVILMLLTFASKFVLQSHLLPPALESSLLWMVVYYLPSYLIGAFYGMHAGEKMKPESLSYILLLLVSAFALQETFPDFLGELVIRALPIAALFLLPEFPKLYDKKVYALTFLLYALHYPLITLTDSVLRKIMTWSFLPATVLNVGIHALVLCMTMAVAWLIYLPLHKFAPGVLRLISGGRAIKPKPPIQCD